MTLGNKDKDEKPVDGKVMLELPAERVSAESRSAEESDGQTGGGTVITRYIVVKPEGKF